MPDKALFLIDNNLPYRVQVWQNDKFVFSKNLGKDWDDLKIWEYARVHNLTIVTKDSDFSNLILTNTPPPKVIHFKIGNMKLSELKSFIDDKWDDISNTSKDYKLVNVFQKIIEGIN